MDKILAVCQNPKCKAVLDITSVFSAFSTITINSSTYQPCPHCGSKADILDGVYKSLRQLEKPELIKLKEVAREAKANNFTPEEFKSKAEKISPGVKSFINTQAFNDFMGSQKGSNYIAFFTGLIAAITGLIAVFNTPPTVVNNYNTTNNYFAETPRSAPAMDSAKTKRQSNYTPPKKKRKKNR